MTETLYREQEKFIRKLYRTEQHINFLTQCHEHNILPNFTILSKSTIEKLQLKKPQIMNHRYKIFDEALQKQENDAIYFNSRLNNLFQQIHAINPEYASKNFSISKSTIIKSQFNDDKI